MFEVYKITFDNNKSYIGYTSKGVMNRLTKHKQNAEGGLDTHFYRAIRKYGLGKIKIKILWRGKNKEEAQQKEKYFIDYYNTYTTGYNQTKGGDGGFSVDNIKEWKRKLSKATTLDRNPKYSGYTDEQIIEKAIDYYIDNNHKLVRRHWTKYSKENGLPQHYSKNRFDG